MLNKETCMKCKRDNTSVGWISESEGYWLEGKVCCPYVFSHGSKSSPPVPFESFAKVKDPPPLSCPFALEHALEAARQGDEKNETFNSS